MTDSYLARVSAWLAENGEPGAVAVAADPYGLDWDGDTNGGFVSSFAVTINFVRPDDSKATKYVEGDEMESLWRAVVVDAP